MINDYLKELDDLDRIEYDIELRKEQLLVVAQVFDKIRALDDEVKRVKEIQDNVKEQLLTAMRDNGHEVFENEFVRVKYTAPSTRSSVDTTKLKATYPEVYDDCRQESIVKDRVTITYKSKKEAK